MGKTVIVTGGTHKDVSAMGVLALNLKEVAPRLADKMIIFHDGIKRKNNRLLKKYFQRFFMNTVSLLIFEQEERTVRYVILHKCYFANMNVLDY